MIQQSRYWAYMLRESIILKDTCTPNVHCRTVYNNQDMDAT